MAVDGFYDIPEEQQRIKTQIVSDYFWSWKTIILKYARGRVAYIDLFAGPGRFDDGTESTPLHILRLALEDERLRKRLVTVFNDKNAEYIEDLRGEVCRLPAIDSMTYPPVFKTVEIGAEIVDWLKSTKTVPALFFVDPWGYKGLSLDLIGSAIRSWGCDCIFYFNYNRINPSISNTTVSERMDELFGSSRASALRVKVSGLEPDQRQETIVNELVEALQEVGGRYVVAYDVESAHQDRTSHYIVFVSKNFAGYDIMKKVMHKLSSDPEVVKEFGYRPRRSGQLRLLDDDPSGYSIPALKRFLMEVCAGDTMLVKECYHRHSVDTPYIFEHFQQALRELEAEGLVQFDRPPEKRMSKGQLTVGQRRRITFFN